MIPPFVQVVREFPGKPNWWGKNYKVVFRLFRWRAIAYPLAWGGIEVRLGVQDKRSGDWYARGGFKVWGRQDLPLASPNPPR